MRTSLLSNSGLKRYYSCTENSCFLLISYFYPSYRAIIRRDYTVIYLNENRMVDFGVGFFFAHELLTMMIQSSFSTWKVKSDDTGHFHTTNLPIAQVLWFHNENSERLDWFFPSYLISLIHHKSRHVYFVNCEISSI